MKIYGIIFAFIFISKGFTTTYDMQLTGTSQNTIARIPLNQIKKLTFDGNQLTVTSSIVQRISFNLVNKVNFVNSGTAAYYYNQQKRADHKTRISLTGNVLKVNLLHNEIGNGMLTLHNLQGQCMMRHLLHNSKAGEISIPLKLIPQGTYIASVGNRKYASPIIIQ